jgi:hypothetical protein
MNFKNKTEAHAAMKSRGYKRNEYTLVVKTAWLMLAHEKYILAVVL